jgi:hypothetical protein
VRFTRGVPVEGKKALDPIMVRRLKRDLRQLGVERFPRRLLVQLALSNLGGAWRLEQTRYDAETGEEGKAVVSELGRGQPIELTLGEKLQRYTELCAPGSGQGRLPFIHMQQRLLSSPEAFARTLEVHAQGLAKKGGPVAAPQQQKLSLSARAAKAAPVTDLAVDPETHGFSDEALAEESDALVRRASATLPSPTEEARALLAEMRALAEKARREPDAKSLALLGWMREHLCPAIGLGEGAGASRAWTPRRVILFTEYADTKRYLVELLAAAVAPTEDGEQRILQFHGGMGDDARDEVQRAFNSKPGEHPVRILVATDAAREGVNLQAHCADLFHIDIPWNPARMEQRNGRIDRTLQPAAEVRCHYFVYPQRTEDQVLETAVRKIATVQRELGSLGAVLLGQIEAAFENGITGKVRAVVEKVGAGAEGTANADPRLTLKTATVDAELESRRTELEAVRAEVERAGRRLESSRRALEVEPDALRGVVEIGLGFGAKAAEGVPKPQTFNRLAGASALKEVGKTSDDRATYELPALDRSWDVTLDVLRPPRGRTEDFWAWRQKPSQPVTFHPLASLSEGAEQLHLAHPLVKRILDRFLAQGFGAHDLSRFSAVVAPDSSVKRVVAFARLTLFGIGAARLHDQLVPIAAAWSGEASGITPYKDRATAMAAIASTERLLAGSGRAPNATIGKNIQKNAEALFRALWPHLEAEADALAVEARHGLAERARREAEEMRGLLVRQRAAIDKAEERLRQGDLFNIQDKEQKRQVDLDLRHLERRRTAAASEMESEPAAIEALYDVRMARLTPVGLVVAWPESMT